MPYALGFISHAKANSSAKKYKDEKGTVSFHPPPACNPCAPLV